MTNIFLTMDRALKTITAEIHDIRGMHYFG